MSVLKHLQGIWFLFHDFDTCAAQRQKDKRQLKRAFEDKKLVTLIIGSKQCLNHANWGQEKYWNELLLLPDSRYFGQWTTAELNKQTTNQLTIKLDDVIMDIEQFAPRLIGLF